MRYIDNVKFNSSQEITIEIDCKVTLTAQQARDYLELDMLLRSYPQEDLTDLMLDMGWSYIDDTLITANWDTLEELLNRANLLVSNKEKYNEEYVVTTDVDPFKKFLMELIYQRYVFEVFNVQHIREDHPYFESILDEDLRKDILYVWTIDNGVELIISELDKESLTIHYHNITDK
jgi:hypothetical protein